MFAERQVRDRTTSEMFRLCVVFCNHMSSASIRNKIETTIKSKINQQLRPRPVLKKDSMNLINH
jgi:hypothetical protein